MVAEKNLQKMIEIVNQITKAVSEEHQAHIFWCPKTISDDGEVSGYRLYAYGGYVLRIFEKDKQLKFETNFLKYKDKYFGELWDETFDKMYLKLNENSVDTLLEIVPHMQTVLKAYQKWKKLERRRETTIARNVELCPKSNNFCMIEMESRMKTSGKKPDLVGIRNENGRTILSFIEYKCTKAGMNGVTLTTHFEDMIKYYQDVKMDAGYKTLYAQMQDFAEFKLRQLGRTSEFGKIQGGEIVFLFSHIGEEDFSAQKVYNSVKFLIHMCKKYPEHREHVKFLILKDENELYSSDNYMSAEDFLAHEIFAECLTEQWKQIRG